MLEIVPTSAAHVVHLPVFAPARSGAARGAALGLRALGISALGIGALLAGCVGMPQDADLRAGASGPSLPNAWSTAETAGAATEDDDAPVFGWIHSFDDAGLTALVREAIANNHDLAASAARVIAAAADADSAGADLLPSASIGADASRRTSSARVPSFPSGDTIQTSRSTSYGISLDVGWEVDLWGRLREGTNAAEADFASSRADFAAARLSIAAQTAKGWFAVTEARSQLAVARESVDFSRQNLDLTRVRVDEGLVSPLDLRLALSDLANTEATILQRRETVERETRRLEVLVGRAPRGTIETAIDLPEPPPPVPAGVPAAVVARRPDLIAAERRLASADHRFAASRAALLPRLNLTASGGSASDNFRDLLSGDFLLWSIAGGITQPLIDGGRLRAQVRSSDARAAAALSDYAASVLDALFEVDVALAVESLLAEREGYLRIAADEATRSTAIARTRYTEGADPLLTLLDTQRRELDRRSALLSVRRSRLENRIDLLLALGGAFDAPADETPPDDTTAAAATEETR